MSFRQMPNFMSYGQWKSKFQNIGNY